MRLLFTLSICILFNISIDAQAELVHEFFEGSDGTTVYTDFSSTYNQNTSVKLTDDLILFSAKGDLGQELYKIDKGQLSLVKDIKTGEENSSPQYLTIFEGMVYFIAEGNEGARIYKTDGTEAGTQIAFELGDEDSGVFSFSEFLIGRDGRLYFEFDGTVYTYRNENLVAVMHTNPLNAGGSSNHNDYSWALYKDGVVVLDVNEGELFILSIIDNEVTELATAPWDGGFDRQFATESFEGGVFFSIESFDSSVEGDYVYKESNGTVKKISSDAGNHRSEYIDDKSCVVSGYKKATYLFNSNFPEGKELNDNKAFSFAGGTWSRERLGDGLLYVGAGGTFDDTEIYFIDREGSTADLVHTTDDVSRMKTDGSYTFYFGESEQGDQFSDEDLFAFNHTTKEASPIKTLFDTPFNTNITPLGVIDQELYFFGILDNEVGMELYKIDIGFKTAVDNEELAEVLLKKQGDRQYLIDYDSNESFNVSIRSIDGKLLDSRAVMANSPFEVEARGIVLITVEADRKTKTFKVFN